MFTGTMSLFLGLEPKRCEVFLVLGLKFIIMSAEPFPPTKNVSSRWTVYKARIHASIHGCMQASIYPCIHPSLHPSMHLSIHPSMHLFTHVYTHTYTHLSMHLSIYASSHPSIHLFIHPSIQLTYLLSISYGDWCCEVMNKIYVVPAFREFAI